MYEANRTNESINIMPQYLLGRGSLCSFVAIIILRRSQRVSNTNTQENSSNDCEDVGDSTTLLESMIPRVMYRTKEENIVLVPHVFATSTILVITMDDFIMKG